MEIIESVAVPKTVRGRNRLQEIHNKKRLREINESLRSLPHSKLRKRLAKFIYMAERSLDGTADQQRRTIQ